MFLIMKMSFRWRKWPSKNIEKGYCQVIREGKFGAMKIGKDCRVPKSVVDSFFNEAVTAPYPSEDYGFGIWADRVDISEDSLEYVNKIREQSDKKDLPDIITEVEGSL